MRTALIFILTAFSILSSAQDEIRLASVDGNVVVICEVQSSKIVTSIKSVLRMSGEIDTVVHLPTAKRDNIYLHITDRDTALFVLVDDERYYLYHLVSELSESDRNQSLLCSYSRVMYPQHARTEGVEGTAIVDAFLDEQGCVVSIDKKTDIGYGLEKATVRAVKKCSCRFPPVKFQGVNVKTVYTIPMLFRMD